MKKTTSYTDKDIKILTDRDHSRLRTSMYLGNINTQQVKIPLFHNNTLTFEEVEFSPAVFKAVDEIIMNSLDEFTKCDFQKNKVLTLDYENDEFTIKDNGRGVPIGKHSSGPYTPEVVFTSFKSGRNFDDDTKQVGITGQNGIGAAATAFTSEYFKIDIKRDGKHYSQLLTEGTNIINPPVIKSITSQYTGTSISFKLDSSVYKNIKIPEIYFHNRAIEIALCNPGVAVEYKNKTYKFKKGFENIIEKISDTYFEFSVENDQMHVQWFIIPSLHKELDERICTWVNGSYLFDGGLCNTQFMNAFSDSVLEHLQPLAKRAKIEVTKNDVRQGLTIIGNLRIKNPQYDSQSKTRLTGPNLRNEFVGLLSEQWSLFARRNKVWLQQILDRAAERHNKDANKQAEKQLAKQSKQKIDNLRDATSKRRQDCILFITEGLSAAGQITEVRDPNIHAIFTLTGKINNVYGCTVSQLLKMEKLLDLIAAVGLVPGKKADRSSLRYGQLALSTDADTDGDDIATLLVNFFYTFWPELFDPKLPSFIVRLNAPNVVASKNNKRVHFTTMEEFRKHEDKHKGWTIEYMKGLGSMHKQDWEMLLQNFDKHVIRFKDDANMKQTLELLFGPDANKRKEWLTRK